MPFSVVTKKRCVLILSFLLIITLPPDLPEAFFSITANNKALVGFTYRAIDNADWLDCMQACQAEVSCISYNFWQGRCELNNCGFEDGCSAESTLLIWVPGSTFQQLAPIQDEKSRCKDKRESSVKKNVRVMINASFSCTQNMSAYVDGDFVTFLNSRKPVKDIDCSKLQTQAINFAIPNSTRVVAIAATGIPRASIIGSFSDGVVTDSTWKCNSDKQPKWALPDFKDDLWKEAEETSPEKGGTNGITEISSKNQSQHRNCRWADYDQPIPEAAFEIQGTDVCERSWIDELSQALGRERHSADVCGNKPVLLDKCLLEDRGRIHLTSVKYMECNCSCMDCSDEGTELCPWSKVYKIIKNECHRSEVCRVRIANNCENAILRSLRIEYRCV